MRKGNYHTIKGKGFDKYPEHINKKGGPKKIPSLDKLLSEIYGEDKEGRSKAQEIIDALHKQAEKGNVRAGEVILERLYGKVKLPIEHAGSIDLHFDKDFEGV